MYNAVSFITRMGSAMGGAATLDNLTVDSSGYTLQENLTVTGDVTVNGGILDINSYTLSVNGGLTITGNNGRLKMVNDTDLVEVSGHVTFYGASTKDYLTAGVLKVGGDFIQKGTLNPDTYGSYHGNNWNSFTATGTQQGYLEWNRSAGGEL